MVNWQECEYDNNGFSAHMEPGLVLDVTPDGDKWFWRVDLTSAVSESPECWNLGWTDTLERAKVLAEDCAAEAAPKLTKREIA